MRVLHLPSTFFPEHTGGKEVFVLQLIKNTASIGIQHSVLLFGNQPRHYIYEGIEVLVLKLPQSDDFRTSYYSGLYDNLDEFSSCLERLSPDLVHFHDQNSAASLSHLRVCRALGIKTLLTYHSPGQSCSQRALLYAGKSPCQGRMDDTICTICRYQVLGFPYPLARLAAAVKIPGERASRLFQRNNTYLFNKGRRIFFGEVDGIQVHANWVRDLLMINGVPGDKIHFIELAGMTSSVHVPTGPHGTGDLTQPLRIVFIGRCTFIKGIHLLIDAILQIDRNLPIEVYFFGPDWDTAYGQEQLQKVKGDERFKSPQLVPPHEVAIRIRRMDVCVIPSLWPETGPFTLFDAFGADLPVIGTRYAGIAERVEDGVNGLLFEWGNSNDLADKIQYLLRNRHYLDILRSNIKSNRTMREFGLDMKRLYDSLIKQRAINKE